MIGAVIYSSWRPASVPSEWYCTHGSCCIAKKAFMMKEYLKSVSKQIENLIRTKMIVVF